MKYVFCSFMFDDAEENIKHSKSPNSVSGHKVQVNMAKGLAENGCDIAVVNIPRVRRYPDYPQLVFRRKAFSTVDGIEGISIGFLNIFGLNYLSQIRSVYKEVKKIVQQSKQEEIVLLVYNTYPAPTIALRKIRKKYPRIRICNVIGDIYGQYGLSSSKNLHGKLLDAVHAKMDRMASQCDAFGLATEEMAEALNISSKPYIVLEGMYDAQENKQVASGREPKEKTVFYAGALLDEYGIGHMLRAFAMIRDPEYRFMIAGGGEAAEMVKNAEEKDARIHYLGFITPKEVEAYQASATVLVNPRTSEHEYVRYSFASKNLECLASGVPYIAHNLPCNPKEYSDYILYPENETDEALARKIEETCNLDISVRSEIGERNKAFIKTRKNPKIQMGRLDSMLRSA